MHKRNKQKLRPSRIRAHRGQCKAQQCSRTAITSPKPAATPARARSGRRGGRYRRRRITSRRATSSPFIPGTYKGFDLTHRRHRRRPDHLQRRAGARTSTTRQRRHHADGINLEGADYITDRRLHRQPAAAPRRHPRRHERPRHHPQQHLRPQRHVGHLHRLQRRPPDREQHQPLGRRRARHLRLQQRRPPGHPRQHASSATTPTAST